MSESSKNISKEYNSPILEMVEPNFGNSFTYKLFAEKSASNQPFWHYHPEIELVYVEKSSGKRHIGNHLSYYNDGDLVLIGPNLPHVGFGDRLTGDESEVVVQFKLDFMGAEFFDRTEMRDIKSLLERAKSGISFYGRTKDEVGILLKDFNWVKIKFDQLLQLLRILQNLALSQEYELLNANDGLALVMNPQDNDRMDLIYDFIRGHFEEKIYLEEIAEAVSMSIPSFSRYFKKMAGKTFSEFLMEFRIVHASKLLAEDQMSITEICFSSGFNNFSHFTKSFKRITGKSPSEYKKTLYKVVQL
ncbi:helix-turn-helix domain-containing protein [Portibacter lacus]|uniref:AraC family transcriptional regulator n=1 Tax=Portibacter lacus TaxID=1099794 RepID=A0AA37STC7_9BACT|nr:AraC family transcriptional regulator [Portibacter lacus]GLR17720.1 AraC family transcriptional regulator [Portibacter lacus]